MESRTERSPSNSVRISKLQAEMKDNESDKRGSIVSAPTGPQHRRVFAVALAGILVVTSGALIGCSRSEDGSSAKKSSPPVSEASGSTDADDDTTSSTVPESTVVEQSTGPGAVVAEDGTMELPASADVLPIPIVGPALPPVHAHETASFGDDIQVSITRSESMDVQAKLPGETSGPATVLTLSIDNRSSRPIDLTNVIVDLLDDEGRSFNQITSAAQASTFDTPLDPGASSSASFVFRPGPTIGPATYLTVNYTAAEPTVVFAGRITND